MRVDLAGRPARWEVDLRTLPGAWEVGLVASDGDQEQGLSDPVHRFTFWPWARARWRFAVRAAVRTFPPGRPFGVMDLVRALPRGLQKVVKPGHVAYILTLLWKEGEVVKVRRRRWAVPVHPDFSPERWRAFLEEVWRKQGDRLGPGCQEECSITYLVRLWERRIQSAETVEALQVVGQLIQKREPNPKVRERLRPIYWQRMQELRERGDEPRMGGG